MSVVHVGVRPAVGDCGFEIAVSRSVAAYPCEADTFVGRVADYAAFQESPSISSDEISTVAVSATLYVVAHAIGVDYGRSRVSGSKNGTRSGCWRRRGCGDRDQSSRRLWLSVFKSLEVQSEVDISIDLTRPQIFLEPAISSSVSITDAVWVLVASVHASEESIRSNVGKIAAVMIDSTSELICRAITSMVDVSVRVDGLRTLADRTRRRCQRKGLQVRCLGGSSGWRDMIRWCR